MEETEHTKEPKMRYTKQSITISQSSKVNRLAVRLSIHYAEAVGCLSCLWANATANKEDGDITEWSDEDIAFYSRWEGNAKDYAKAIRAEHFVDRKGDRDLIHDWITYSGDHLKARYRRSNPALLVAIWAMHGLTFGAEQQPEDSPLPEQPKPPEPEAPEVTEKLEQIVRAWNEMAVRLKLSKVSTITPRRKKGMLARLKQKGFDPDAIFQAIQEQPFLVGESKQGWKVDFDWIFLHTENYIKVMERKYLHASSKGKANPGSRGLDTAGHGPSGGVKGGGSKYGGIVS